MNAWNTEPTVPSIGKTELITDQVEVELNDFSIFIDLYDTPLRQKWLDALDDNLKKKRILEKNFCFLGFANNKRNLSYLCGELNQHIKQINSFQFEPAYEFIHSFSPDDFQYSDKLPMGISLPGEEMQQPGLRLKHESCNLLHRYFEQLQGTAWRLSDYYKQADTETKYSIRQLNNLCHEIESWVLSYRKSVIDPDWIRPSQITTFLTAPRYDLDDSDFMLFKHNRYDRELGGVYLHWSQVGKTLFEVFRDEGGVKMDEATCSEINHQKYYSGEFDIEWGQSITEANHDFKKQEIEKFRQWLDMNGYDWEDPKLSLGYLKLGQVNLEKSFGADAQFKQIYSKMIDNLNITKIKNLTSSVECEYTYSLDDENWKLIQIEGLKSGYESSSLR